MSNSRMGLLLIAQNPLVAPVPLTPSIGQVCMHPLRNAKNLRLLWT